jgi:hypothetical protein
MLRITHWIWLAFATITVGLSTLPAEAQIRFQGVPLDFAFAAKGQFRPFASTEVGSVTASFVVENVQASINAVLPSLSSGLVCSAKNYTEVMLKSISFQQMPSESGALKIFADAHVRECHSIPLYEGDVGVSVPLSIPHTGQTISLHADPPEITPTGFVFVGFVPAPNSLLTTSARKIITPKINGLVSDINGQIKRGFNAVSRFVAAYSVSIQSSNLTYDNGDLVVSMKLSGQVPLAVAKR